MAEKSSNETPHEGTTATSRESGSFLTSKTEASRELRERAKAKATERPSAAYSDLTSLSPAAVRALVHELQVHQIELEMQNEELRRAQEELEVSRSRYFELYDLAPVGYVTIGEDGLVREANLTAAGLLGIARSALIKQPFTRFVCPEDQDRYFKHRKQLFLVGAPHGCELRLLKDGRERVWVRLEASLAPGVDQLRAARTVLSDISERKRAEETLALSEARHRTLFESSPDALTTLAPPEWFLTSGNTAAIAMFGACDQADFATHQPWDYSAERQPDGQLSKDRFKTMLERAMQNGSHSFEWVYQRSPSETFNATVVLTRMEANGARFIQASVRDETKVQEQRVRIAQTERLATMGLLAASVGHEINNPLAYVVANAQSLTEVLPKIAKLAERCLRLESNLGKARLAELLGDDRALFEPALLKAASDHARDTLEGAQRITRISRALSAFSRVGATELGSVDVQAALEAASAMAFNEIRFRGTLLKDYQALPPVWANEGKLSQVFLNLLMNAAQALAEAKRDDNRITIRTRTEAGSVFVEVEDSGVGIAAENLIRIFEPFFSTKRVEAGTGLGLSICRNIIAEFGGEISVESELGKGTRFVVRLPAHVEAEESHSTAHDSPSTASPALRGRVLIIDDEAPLRTVMMRLLAAHDLVSVASGKEALAILEHDQAFDLILCDLMMPGMTGMDVHRWLLARAPRLAARVVFVTGGVFGPVAAEYVAESGNIKLEKPFDKATFQRLVTDRVLVARSEPPQALASEHQKLGGT